jgi:hypothetical protein
MKIGAGVPQHIEQLLVAVLVLRSAAFTFRMPAFAIDVRCFFHCFALVRRGRRARMLYL